LSSSGWGRGTWGQGAWNQSISVAVTVSVTGVGATTALGDEQTNAGANVLGVAAVATTSLGNEAVSGSASFTVSGVAATSAVGNETAIGTATVSVSGVAGTTSVGNETVAANSSVAVIGNEARGNEDLGGARHAEYFVPTDSDDPDITVIAFEASTTVSADGSSLGTISSAGGTLTVSASNYENKIISANKPITLQSGDNQTVGVPTSWAGTSFGFRNTRTGLVLQMRALYGTASVEIFKDGVSTTTLSVGSTATTTQSYADDDSDPEYTVFSDYPIIVFKTRATSLSGDSRPAFPATTDFLYGFAAATATAVLVDGYGGTSQTFTRFASDGTSDSSTISTTNGNFATGTDFTGPSNRYQTAKASAAFSIADSDGGEKTSFIPEGCFAHEFRLIEAAEFVNFIGAPSTNGRKIQVYNSSGTLVDTIQLATSNTGSDFPTKFQLISSTTTDSNLTGSKKSYELTAGMRFVSEVPVGAIVEDDSSDRESNLFGLRNFPGFTTGTAAVAATGVVGTSTVGSVTVVGTSSFTVTGVAGTSTLGNETVAAGATLTVAGVAGTSQLGDEATTAGARVTGVSAVATTGLGDESVVGTSSFTVTGVAGTSTLGNETVAAGATLTVAGVTSTSTLGSETVTGAAVVSPSTVLGTTQVGDEQTNAGAVVTGVGVATTVSFGEESVTADANLDITGVLATSSLGSETVSGGSSVVASGVTGTGLATTVPTIASGYPVTGVAGTGNIGIVQIYTSIVPSQTPDWTEVEAASPSWSEETPSQNPDWTEIAA